jgi:hypothetical protein
MTQMSRKAAGLRRRFPARVLSSYRAKIISHGWAIRMRCLMRSRKIACSPPSSSPISSAQPNAPPAVAIARKIEGNLDEQRATATKRLEIREIMGEKLMREITLK